MSKQVLMRALAELMAYHVEESAKLRKSGAKENLPQLVAHQNALDALYGEWVRLKNS